MHANPPRLGIVSAMQQEQSGLIEHMEAPVTSRRGMRDYVCGRLWGREVVCVLSRMGKVAAAATTATLIESFGVGEILFTGVAGGTANEVKIGDLVLAEQLIQHDMDARPLFPRWEVPLTQRASFASDAGMTARLAQACEEFLKQDLPQVIASAERDSFQLANPRLHRGLIASADEFVHGPDRAAQLKALLPDLLAVEMEGAAVAQVCYEFGLPFAVIRTISDEANAQSAVDFLRFVDRIASQYALHVVRRYCLAA